MQIKFNDNVSITGYDWLAQKDWWEAECCGVFYKITDPEVPSYARTSGSLMINSCYVHQEFNGVAYRFLTPDGEGQVIRSTANIGGCIKLGPGLHLTAGGTLTVNVERISNSTMSNSTMVCKPGQDLLDKALNQKFEITLPAVADATDYEITATSPLSFKFSDCEDNDDAARNMSELGLDDLISDAQSAQVTTRRITVNADAPYWKALKGLHGVLDGRHLKFYRGITANIDCQEYGDVECMVLATVEDIECNDVFLGKYVQGIKGLIIPCEFLD